MSETITKPYRVLVSPRSGATVEFGSLFSTDPIVVDRVVVHGGKQWIPYWDKKSTNYDAPSRVDVHLRGQSQPKSFSGDASYFVQVFGGTRGILSRIFRSSRATVAGECEDPDYLLGCDLIVGAEPNFNKDADTVRRVQAALVSVLPRYSHADFQALDAALKKDPGGLGKFGPLTKRAVATFNRLYGFGQGEVIDRGTLEVIAGRRGLWVEGAVGAPIADAPVVAVPSVPSPVLDPYVAEAKVAVERAVEVKAAAKTPSEVQVAQSKVEAAVKLAEAVALTAPPEAREAAQKFVEMIKAAQSAAPSEVKQEVAKVEGKASSGSFLTREYGGVPVYAWGIGGVSLLGILALGIKMVFGGRRQAT